MYGGFAIRWAIILAWIWFSPPVHLARILQIRSIPKFRVRTPILLTSISEEFDVPEPSNDVVLRKWGGNNQMIAREQIEMALDQRVPVIATGLGGPDYLFQASA